MLEAVGVGAEPELIESGLVYEAPKSEAIELERDFWSAFVRVSLSRAKASEIQESEKGDRKIHGSMLAKFSDVAIWI